MYDGAVGKSIKIRNNLTSFAISSLIGLAYFFLIFGGLSFLNPSNLIFVIGDSKSHYVSQLFFLSDDWRFPLGLNPNYGQEFSFTSSINGPGPFPLLFFQKLFGLRADLQFYGLLTWFNLTLHHQLARRILLRFNFGFVSQHLFGLMFFTPFLLFRLELHPFSVAIQWPILWAILILLKRHRGERIKYGEVFSLVFLSYAIFINIWFIVVCVLLFQITQIKTLFLDLSKEKLTILSRVNPIICGTLFASFLIDGLFLFGTNVANGVDRVKTEGWGVYSYNILSIFNPDTGIRDDWYFKPGVGNVEGWTYNMSTTRLSLGMTYGSYEGFSYIGLGAIVLGLISLYHYKRNLIENVKTIITPLSFMYTLVLVIYAIAPTRIAIGSLDVRIVPSEIINLIQPIFPFRSSGRMMISFAYLLILVAIVSIKKAFPSRTCAIISFCLIIQFIDLSSPLLERYSFAKDLTQQNLDWRSDVPTELSIISKGKKELRTFPVENPLKGYEHLAWWAWQLNLSTNSVYSARPNQNLLSSVSEEEKRKICFNMISSDAVYAVQQSESGTGKLRNCDLSLYATTKVNNWLFLAKISQK